MTFMTSAYANKLLKKLQEDKAYWLSKESEGTFYVAALDEEPVIPTYDYSTVARTIEEIDEKIVTIKHAVNLANLTNELDVNGQKMTVDMILIRMAQLNKRKYLLDTLRKQEPKTRIETSAYLAKKMAPEYRYINYNLDVVKAEYERIDDQISQMQMALDKYNQTVEFEVEI